MSIDPLFSKRYDKAAYNCAHFLVDAWRHVTGEDLGDRLAGFLRPPAARVVDWGQRHGFAPLDRPRSPCIVAMHRPRTVPHVGMYYRGRVLHLHERGVEYQPLDVASRGFTKLRYYACL